MNLNWDILSVSIIYFLITTIIIIDYNDSSKYHLSIWIYILFSSIIVLILLISKKFTILEDQILFYLSSLFLNLGLLVFGFIELYIKNNIINKLWLYGFVLFTQQIIFIVISVFMLINLIKNRNKRQLTLV